MTHHESPPILRRGAWVSNGRIQVWQPEPEPDGLRRCRICFIPIGPRKQLCDYHRDECRRETFRRNTNSRRSA